MGNFYLEEAFYNYQKNLNVQADFSNPFPGFLPNNAGIAPNNCNGAMLGYGSGHNSTYFTIVNFDSLMNYEPIAPVSMKEFLKNSKEAYTVFPNPATTVINIVCNNSHKLKSVQIFNQLGEVIDEEKDLNDERPFAVDVEALDSGFYILKLNTVEGSVTKKITISK